MSRSRRFVITGVGRGLGRELATRLIDSGNEVWGTSRSDEPLPGSAGHLRIDLIDETSIVDAARLLAAQTDAIDVLINCAGTDGRAFGAGDQQRGPFDLDADPFNAVLAVNVTGPMLVTRHLLDLLRNGTDPMVVNVSSQLGSMQVASRIGRDTAYCVSKAALNMLSVKSAAALRAEGVGVVMIHPGWVNTDMGGPSADLDLPDAAAMIADTINNLSIADTGRFVRWDGHDHPW